MALATQPLRLRVGAASPRRYPSNPVSIRARSGWRRTRSVAVVAAAAEGSAAVKGAGAAAAVGAGVLLGREPARPGGGGAADRGGVRVRGPGVPAAHGGAGPGGGLLPGVHGVRQPQPPLRHRRHLRRRPLGRRRHLAPQYDNQNHSCSSGCSMFVSEFRCAGCAEWKGRPFPFSRGCSFYRCQPDPERPEQIQIVYGRDCVEPATKPGELELVAIRGVTWLLERLPSLTDRL